MIKTYEINSGDQGEVIPWKDLYARLEEERESGARSYSFRYKIYNEDEDAIGHLLEFCLFCYKAGTYGDVRTELRIDYHGKNQYAVESKLANILRYFITTCRLRVYLNNSRIPLSFDKYRFDLPENYFPVIPINRQTYEDLFCTKVKDVAGAQRVLNYGFLYSEQDIDEGFNTDEMIRCLRDFLETNKDDESKALIQEEMIDAFDPAKPLAENLNRIILKAAAGNRNIRIIANCAFRYLKDRRISKFRDYENISRFTVNAHLIILGHFFHSLSSQKVYLLSAFSFNPQDHDYFKYLAVYDSLSLLSKRCIPASKKSRENLAHFYHFFSNHSIFTTFLISSLYKRYKGKGADIDTDKAKKEFNDIKYIGLLYAYGMKEIVENVIKHTADKIGVLYVRLHSDRGIENIFPEIEGYKDPDQRDEIKGIEDKKWIEVSVLDCGQKGMIQTYGSDKIKTLSDLFSLDFHQVIEHYFGGNTRQLSNILFYKGLRIFSQHVTESKGIYQVQTVNGSQVLKQMKLHDRSFDTETDSKAAIGTSYRIFLPFTGMRDNPYLDLFSDYDNTYVELRAIWGTDQPRKKPPQELSDSQVFEFEAQDTDSIEGDIARFDDYINGIKDRLSFLFIGFAQKKKRNAVKLLYYVVLACRSKDITYVALYDIDCDIMAEFRSSYISLMEDDYYFDRVNVKEKPYFFFFNENGIPFVTQDFEKKKTNSINIFINNHRCIFHAAENKDWDRYVSGDSEYMLSEEEKTELLFPLEALSGREKLFEAPIFEAHLVNLFASQISSRNLFGLKYEGHIKLGSKLHVDTFYQAELLFDNSYYTLCFAYMLSKMLYNNTQNGTQEGILKLFLVGYKQYSANLIGKIAEILEDRVSGWFIYEETETEDERTWVDTAGVEVIIIVPIASTLKTFNKIHSFLMKNLLKQNPDAGIQYYTFFISRDRNEGQKRCPDTNTSELEREYGWVKVAAEDKQVIIKGDEPFPEEKNINYFMLVESNWYKATACPICRENDKILLSTDDSSLVLDTKLGLPFNTVKDRAYIQFETEVNGGGVDEVMECLSKHIVFGHLQRNRNHFLYYVDTMSFFHSLFENFPMLLQGWAKLIADSVGVDHDVVNIVLAPKHYSNNNFINWIEETVFNGSSIIIREDFENEFYSNFWCKYSFLNKIKKKRVIFIDDCINTGKNFLKAKSLIDYGNNNTDRMVIITLVDRLDYHNKIFIEENAGKMFSFIWITIPIIKEQGGQCWLCQEQDAIGKLQLAASGLPLKRYYRRKYELRAIKNIISAHDVEKLKNAANGSFAADRFLITNRIYYNLFKENTEESNILAEDLKKALGVSADGLISTNIITGGEAKLSYKISFIKVLALPFLSYFYSISEICLNICRQEMDLLLRTNVEGLDYQQAGETANMLVVLIKQLARLNSQWVTESCFIDKTWEFYARIVKRQAGIETEEQRETQKSSGKKTFGMHYSMALSQMVNNDPTKSLVLYNNLTKYSGIVVNKLGCGENDNQFRKFLECVLLQKDPLLTIALDSFKNDKKLFVEANEAEMKRLVVSNYYYEQLRVVYGQWGADVCKLLGHLHNFKTGETGHNYFKELIQNIIPREKEEPGESNEWLKIIYYNYSREQVKNCYRIFEIFDYALHNGRKHNLPDKGLFDFIHKMRNSIGDGIHMVNCEDKQPEDFPLIIMQEDYACLTFPHLDNYGVVLYIGLEYMNEEKNRKGEIQKKLVLLYRIIRQFIDNVIDYGNEKYLEPKKKATDSNPMDTSDSWSSLKLRDNGD